MPTEDPNLHLVRQRKKIYIKPVPICFLNYEFWKIYLAPSPTSIAPGNRFSDRPAAIGFMRSYSHLIQNRLDFILAQEDHLLPSENWNGSNGPRLLHIFTGSMIARLLHGIIMASCVSPDVRTATRSSQWWCVTSRLNLRKKVFCGKKL